MNTSQECDQCAKDYDHEFGPTDFLERNQEATHNAGVGRTELDALNEELAGRAAKRPFGPVPGCEEDS